MQKRPLWIGILLLAIAGVVGLILFLIHERGHVFFADEASQIDCGADHEDSSASVPCMSAALRACTPALFYDYSHDPIGGISYEITGRQGASCQVHFVEHAKPPAYFKACNFDISAIAALDARLDHPDDLFNTAILEHESDCTL